MLMYDGATITGRGDTWNIAEAIHRPLVWRPARYIQHTEEVLLLRRGDHRCLDLSSLGQASELCGWHSGQVLSPWVDEPHPATGHLPIQRAAPAPPAARDQEPVEAPGQRRRRVPPPVGPGAVVEVGGDDDRAAGKAGALLDQEVDVAGPHAVPHAQRGIVTLPVHDAIDERQGIAGVPIAGARVADAPRLDERPSGLDRGIVWDRDVRLKRGVTRTGGCGWRGRRWHGRARYRVRRSTAIAGVPGPR